MAERFRDIYAPAELPGFPCYSTPRFSTLITQVDSGAEQANRRWQHPLHRFTLPEAVRQHNVFEALRDHWLVMGGPYHTWPFRDPLDFASVGLSAANLVPSITRLDQLIGTGDGATTKFQLVKAYSRGGATHTRNIHLPVAGTVVVAVGGVDPSTLSPPLGWSVSRPGGVVTFDSAPAAAAEIRAGFLFDTEVRFEADDSFDGIVRSYQVSGFADVTLLEQRPC